MTNSSLDLFLRQNRPEEDTFTEEAVKQIEEVKQAEVTKDSKISNDPQVFLKELFETAPRKLKRQLKPEEKFANKLMEKFKKKVTL